MSSTTGLPDGPITPRYTTQPSVVPAITDATSKFLNDFAQTHPGLDLGSRFANDLFNALQHQAPLTLFQKIFLFSTFFPGPFEWKISFFSYLYDLYTPHLGQLLPVLFLIAAIFIAWKIVKFSLRARLAKLEPLVFLELTFPAAISKSSYATEQLFVLIHSLARQNRFLYRLFKLKKQYSLEIVASKDKGIRYIIGIAKPDAEIIQRGLQSYMPGLKVKVVNDYLPKDHDKRVQSSAKCGITEFKLRGDFVLPLAEHKTLSEHDPIAYLTGNMTKLKSNELMVFQIVATPVTRSTHKTVIKRISLFENRIYSNLPLSTELSKSSLERALVIPFAVLNFTARVVSACLQFVMSIFVILWDDVNNMNARNLQKTNREVAEAVKARQETLNPYEQELSTSIKSKLDQPLFETSLRLLIQSNDENQYRTRKAGFLASFAPLASVSQALGTKWIFPIIGPWRGMKNFRLRRVSSSGNPILSTSELSDLYHFPHPETGKTEDMVKSKNQELPAPLSFKKSTTKFDNTFAVDTYAGSKTNIGQTLEERRRHTYILGATGSGKTTLLSSMIYNDIKNGKGVCVIDPHGELVERLLAVIPKERINDVVRFAPDDDAYPIALNLLDLSSSEGMSPSQLQKQKSLVASSINSVFQKFYDAKYFGPRMEYILRNTILTSLETPEPTLITVLDILTKKQYRKDVVKWLDNKVLKDFWVYEFEKLNTTQRNQVISPVTNKIGGLLSSPINYNILRQTKSKLDFEKVMNEGKILLCDLSKGKIGEDESSFFGSLIISKLQLAALKRVSIPEKDRKDFFLYVDEFQNFATATFAELVSEARKYRLATILAHQSISQIENRDIVKVILANVGTTICFKTANPEDEQFILPIFSPEVSKHEIANLPLYKFYMKVAVGQAEDTFLAQANNFTAKGNGETSQAVIDASRKQYATSVDDLDQPVSVERVAKPTAKSKKTTAAKPAKKPKNEEVKSHIEPPVVEPAAKPKQVNKTAKPAKVAPAKGSKNPWQMTPER